MDGQGDTGYSGWEAGQEKVLRSLKWLKTGQALEYLKILTGTTISADVLIQFCQEGRLDAFVDISLPGAQGKLSRAGTQVPVAGLLQVINPDMAFRDDEQTVGILRYGDDHWIGLIPRHSRVALFKTAGIEDLANLLNGTDYTVSIGCSEHLAAGAPEVEYSDTHCALPSAIITSQAQEFEIAPSVSPVDEPSTKSRNAYLRTIAALGYALIDGGTGKPHSDANAILAALAGKGVEEPVRAETLANYLKAAESA